MFLKLAWDASATLESPKVPSEAWSVSKFYPSKCRCFFNSPGDLTSFDQIAILPLAKYTHRDHILQTRPIERSFTCHKHMYLGTRAWKFGFGSISGQKPSAGWVFESNTQGFLFAPKIIPQPKNSICSCMYYVFSMPPCFYDSLLHLEYLTAKSTTT